MERDSGAKQAKPRMPQQASERHNALDCTTRAISVILVGPSRWRQAGITSIRDLAMMWLLTSRRDGVSTGYEANKHSVA